MDFSLSLWLFAGQDLGFWQAVQNLSISFLLVVILLFHILLE
jgi:hypothetical protein